MNPPESQPTTPTRAGSIEPGSSDREAADFRLADQINDLYLHGGLAMHRTSRLHALAEIIATAQSAERADAARRKDAIAEQERKIEELKKVLRQGQAMFRNINIFDIAPDEHAFLNAANAALSPREHARKGVQL